MIKHIAGNILDSTAAVIVTQVNCKGKMGDGLNLQIRDRYPFAYKQYANFCIRTQSSVPEASSPTSSLLGETLIVPVNNTQCIAFLFAQDSYAPFGFSAGCLTQYDKLRKCLREVARKYKGRRVAIPYHLGCGLSGGDWNIVLELIESELKDCTVEIYQAEH